MTVLSPLELLANDCNETKSLPNNYSDLSQQHYEPIPRNYQQLVQSAGKITEGAIRFAGARSLSQSLSRRKHENRLTKTKNRTV